VTDVADVERVGQLRPLYAFHPVPMRTGAAKVAAPVLPVPLKR
jgi:hypothetical protein